MFLNVKPIYVFWKNFFTFISLSFLVLSFFYLTYYILLIFYSMAIREKFIHDGTMNRTFIDRKKLSKCFILSFR